MSNNLISSIKLAYSSFGGQETITRASMENLANMNIPNNPEGQGYQAKGTTFKLVLDARDNTPLIKARIQSVPTGSRMVHDPSNPMANDKGFVAMPDIDMFAQIGTMTMATTNSKYIAKGIEMSLDLLRQSIRLIA